MIKSIYRNEFTKKVISLFSGSLVANIMSFGAFFIIAKLYNIDILGQYYMYLSIVVILSELTTVGYLSSIQLLNDEELTKMFNSIFILSIGVIVLVFPFLSFYSELAVYIVLTVILNLYNTLAEKIFIRNMEIKRLNIIRIGRVATNSLLIIASLFIFGGNDINYIIIMNIISIMLMNVFIYLFYLKNEKLFDIKFSQLKILVVYKEFPKYVGPGMICHSIAYQIPILVAGSFFSPAIAAQYNMAYKIVYVPGILISSSISNVFQGRLSKLFRNNDNIFQGFNKFAYTLFLIAVVFISISSIILPFFIEYFFDDEWLGSVDIAMSLLPLIFSLMAVSPLLGVLKFTNNLKHAFRLQFTSLIISIFSFIVSIVTDNFLWGVIIFSSLMLLSHMKIGLRLLEIKRKVSNG